MGEKSRCSAAFCIALYPKQFCFPIWTRTHCEFIRFAAAMEAPRASLYNTMTMPVVGLGMFLAKDEAEVAATISSAIDIGYRHIDTAFSYFNEKFIGNALKKELEAGKAKRDDLYITTKLPPNGLRPENVHDFFNKSLSDLQLEYVDLYLLHFPVATKRTGNDAAIFPMKDGTLQADKGVDIVETWKAMETLVEYGVAWNLGLSNCNSEQIQRIYDAATIKPAVVQVECHAYLPQFELQELCTQLSIMMTAYSPIGAPGQFGPKSKEKRLIDDERLKSICAKHGKSPAQVLLRYLIERHIIVIPKSSNPKRLAENLQIFDFSLTDEEMTIIKSMANNRRYFSFDSYPGMTEQPEYPFRIPF